MLVYFHRNPKTYQIFYVGIASENGRIERPFKKDNRNRYWTHVVEKYGNPIVQIVLCNLEKEKALEWEKYYIKLLGKKTHGGQLVNLSDGGESNEGYTHTEKNKELFRLRALERGTSHMLTPEARMKAADKLSTYYTGRLIGDKNPNFGNRWTEEMKKSMSLKNIGIPFKGCKKKQSIMSKKYWATPGAKDKHREFMKIRQAEYWKNNPEKRKDAFKNVDKDLVYKKMIESHGKKVLCTKSGAVFNTIVDAAKIINMKPNDLRHRLYGRVKNTTNFIFHT
jgi:hypothetical protein